MLDLHTVKEEGPDCHCQWFGTTYNLNDAPQWLHRPCSVPSWLDRFGKKPFVIADMVIYTHNYMLGVSG